MHVVPSFSRIFIIAVYRLSSLSTEMIMSVGEAGEKTLETLE